MVPETFGAEPARTISAPNRDGCDYEKPLAKAATVTQRAERKHTECQKHDSTRILSNASIVPLVFLAVFGKLSQLVSVGATSYACVSMPTQA